MPVQTQYLLVLQTRHELKLSKFGNYANEE